MRTTRMTMTALALAAGMSLTACGGDGGGKDASATSSPSAGSTADGSASDGAGQQDESGPADAASSSAAEEGGAGGQSPSAAAKAERCHTDDLKITASDSTIGGDRDHSVTVTLLNKSGRTCAIGGYAGVNLNTTEGAVPATRRDQKPVWTTLKSGEPTYFGIFYRANDSGGTGARIKGLVVTPPDEKKSVELAWPGEGSLAVSDGSEPSVEIGPMGSAGQGGDNG
ncbi:MULTISPECIES: DUF4232 domain-containing protein [unclassified Streptomyces]|uniref:DUF4232 domain-containing protein n=1 Tax=unclassified Streptomyces TaxID=2593676 RepID=UPI0004CA1BFB|nr:MULTISPECIES: DUF4232 domain-containing protein [unclassified Streptomyces]